MDSQLARLCDAYFRSWMAADPFTATEFGVTGYDAEVPDPSREADSARIAELERLGAEVARLDPATLTPDERVSRSMLLRLAADEREELGGRLDELAVTATSVGAQTRVLTLVPRAPLNEPRRARDYLDRCRKLGGYLDGALARHLEAAREGRLPTARGVAQAVAQLDDYLASDLKDDPLLRPEPPEGVDAEAWRAEAAEIVRTVVRPAMGRYRSALAEELAPAARDDDHAGVVNVEGGLGAYDAAVRLHTTTDLAPEVIHQIGLDLLGGLHAELADVGGRALGAGGVPQVLGRLRDDPALRFQAGDEILAAAQAALRRAEEALPDAFLAYDIAPCQVEAMDPVEAKDAVLGYYLPPSADGARPGSFQVNTYAPAIRTRFEYDALSFHESVPGHHLQFALAQRLEAIPEFRRFAYVTSYCEGWALYCERLADELGLYRGDLERLGMVSFDAWRACRLVVDTGMHALGWSRDRAIGFMRDNTALSESNIANELDRYIAWPGQATAYMVGRLRIRSLRDQARDHLGAAFDLRAFHDALLEHFGVRLPAPPGTIWPPVSGGQVERLVAVGDRRPRAGALPCLAEVQQQVVAEAGPGELQAEADAGAEVAGRRQRRGDDHAVGAEQLVQLADVLEAAPPGGQVLLDRRAQPVLQEGPAGGVQQVPVRLDGVVTELVGVLGGGQRQPVLVEIAGAEDPLRLDRLDRQPQVALQRQQRRVEQLRHVGGQRAPRDEARRGQHPAGPGGPLAALQGRRHRQGGGVAGHRPGLDRQQQAQVLDGGGQRPVGRQVDPVRDRAAADQPAGRLDAGQPAQRRRDPDRAAAVGGGGQRHHPGGQRRARAAAGAARRPPERPGIAGDAEQAVGGVALGGELRQVGLADHDRARRPQPAGDQAVGAGRRRVLEQQRAEGGGHALHVLDVLDQQGSAGQRPQRRPAGGAAVERARLLQRPLGAERHHRAQLAVEPLDALQRLAHQLHRGHPPLPDRLTDPLQPHAASSPTGPRRQPRYSTMIRHNRGGPAPEATHAGGKMQPPSPRYTGYKSFEYLEPGRDYKEFKLAPEIGRVPGHLLADSIVISLHEHPTVFPDDITETFDLIRTGRHRTGYEGLARSGLTALFDNFMAGTSCSTSQAGW